MRKLSNSYSSFNLAILDRKRRERVARKILLIISDYLKRGNKRELIVLDIGCSSGIITTYLARYFKKIIGIDIDVKALNMAKRLKKKNIHFEYMDAKKMSFQDESFDIVICNQVYYYIDNNGQKKLIHGIYRVLKSGGICFLSGLNKYSFKKAESCQRYFLSFIELKDLCSKFKIHSYTAKVLNWLFKIIHVGIGKKIEPILPNFIWILEKP